MKISDLNPNEKNPRKVSPEQLERLSKSIFAFGDLSGIVYNRTTQRLVGAHQRRKILPPESEIVITKTYESPTKNGTIALGHANVNGELFAYREVLWDEATEMAANLAANKHGGDWDYALLTEAITLVDAANIDLDMTGFSNEELENLMAPIGEPKPKEKKQKKCPSCGHEF